MADIDFGGGGTVTIEGDFGSDPSLFSPGGPSINLPDFGGSVDAPTAINEKFLTQLPNLTSSDFSSLPDAPVLTAESQKLIEQQQNISKAAQDLLNQQPQIKNTYQQYEQVYNQNLPLYQKNMTTYSRFMNAYNFNMQQGYGDVGNQLRIANSYLKEAEKYKQKISDAAKTYANIVKDYDTNLENVKKSLSDYQKNYDTFQKEVTEKKAISATPPVTPPVTPPTPPTPVTGPSVTPVTTPVKPGPIDVNIPEPRKDVPPVTEPVAPDLPPITVTPAPDPIQPEPPEPVKPEPPELPPVEPEPPPDEPKPPEEPKPKKPVDDFEITVKPIFLPDVGTLPKKKTLSKPLRTDTLSSTLLGTALQATPSSAEPYLLGTDEKVKNVWNVESLRNALGI